MKRMHESQAADALYRDLRRLDDPTYTPEVCDEMAALIAEIAALERWRDAVILAHNYQRREIFEVADVVGDSLALAREGTKVVAGRIVRGGARAHARAQRLMIPSTTADVR